MTRLRSTERAALYDADMKARIAYLVAAGFVVYQAQHDIRLIPGQLSSLAVALQVTAGDWFVVLVLLALVIVARPGASEGRVWFIVGASLVVTPLAVFAIADAFTARWPWVAAAVAAGLGDAFLVTETSPTTRG